MFYKYTEGEFSKYLITPHFKRKVENHKGQDVTRTKDKIPRDILKNFVTAEWLMECVDKFCAKCKTIFILILRMVILIRTLQHIDLIIAYIIH